MHEIDARRGPTDRFACSSRLRPFNDQHSPKGILIWEEGQSLEGEGERLELRMADERHSLGRFDRGGAISN